MEHTLSELVVHIEEKISLQTKDEFDNVEPINGKPPTIVEGSPCESGKDSTKISCGNVILAESPNLCKQKGDSVSEKKSFIQLIRDIETISLMQNYPVAYLLLSLIAIRAQRKNENSENLKMGEAHIGCFDLNGISRKQYRNALIYLCDNGYVEIVETCRTRKKGATEGPPTRLNGATKRAKKKATVGTKVRLIDSNVYDINEEYEGHQKGHQKGHKRATELAKKGQEQEEQEDKNRRKDHHQSSMPTLNGTPIKKELMIDDFSSKSEKGIHIFEDVYLSKSQLDECIAIKGSFEEVKKCIEKIQKHPDRQYKIKNWAQTLSNWKFSNTTINLKNQNEDYAKKIDEKFSMYKPWSARFYRDRMKDQVGILFETDMGQTPPIFIPTVDKDFKMKVDELIKTKNMKK